MRDDNIARDGDDFIVDAALVAGKFGLSVEAFRAELQRSAIVTICEHGEGEDHGRTRLTFRRGALLWRFIIGQDGVIHEDPILAKAGPSSRPKPSR
ncbi:DUF6522 family protein [Methylocystis rosea]|uniref:DUF6522 family protein n=1 Tax=Methylocystis rosea TaxID=173366 RepID=UPI00037B4FDD|nr:DUF6522 family protein [Methylocystis rosea]